MERLRNAALAMTATAALGGALHETPAMSQGETPEERAGRVMDCLTLFADMPKSTLGLRFGLFSRGAVRRELVTYDTYNPDKFHQQDPNFPDCSDLTITNRTDVDLKRNGRLVDHADDVVVSTMQKERRFAHNFYRVVKCGQRVTAIAQTTATTEGLEQVGPRRQVSINLRCKPVRRG